MSKNKPTMPNVSPVIPDPLPTPQPAGQENPLAGALAILASVNELDEENVEQSEAREKAKNIAECRAQLDEAQKDAEFKTALVKDVQAQADAAQNLAKELKIKLERLSAKSDAEISKEYFAAQHAERVRQAELYQKAVASGLMTAAQLEALGIGRSPADMAIAQRNKANRTAYLGPRK